MHTFCWAKCQCKKIKTPAESVQWRILVAWLTMRLVSSALDSDCVKPFCDSHMPVVTLLAGHYAVTSKCCLSFPSHYGHTYKHTHTFYHLSFSLALTNTCTLYFSLYPPLPLSLSLALGKKANSFAFAWDCRLGAELCRGSIVLFLCGRITVDCVSVLNSQPG